MVRTMKMFGIAGTACFLSAACASEFWVAPDGDDGAAGTMESPFETIQRGVDIAESGDIVWVTVGSYEERVVMKSGIRLRAVEGEEVVLDGSGLTVGEGWDPFVRVEGVVDVLIEGFEMTGLRTDLINRVPVGILVTGASRDVVIRNNILREMGTDFTGMDGGNAHGIAVFGEENEAITGVQIVGNELRDLRLGSSEALVLNGNVSDFLVEGNTVTNCNNIGIDVIGHEEVGPNAELDRARDGIVRANRVTNISSRNNPAYGGDFNNGGGDVAAGGIYVDGGTRILIERNFVDQCDIGIELASEHAGKKTDFVTVRNNVVSNCQGGIWLGGYDEFRGSTEDCVIRNNSFCENQLAGIVFQHYVHRCHVTQNAIVSPVTVPLIAGWVETGEGNVFDWNLYGQDGAAIMEWIWEGVAMEFGGWRGLGFDPHGDFGWPCPVSIENAPHVDDQGRNVGDPNFVAEEGELDFRGAPRILNGRVDVGAFEVDLQGLPDDFNRVKLGADGIVRVGFRGVGRGPQFWESEDLVEWTRLFTKKDVTIYFGPGGWVVEDGRGLAGRYYRVTAEWINE